MSRTAAPFPARTSAARWLALVAHEMRNPLQPLRGFVSLARRRGLADGELLRSLEGAERQLDLLQRLVDDLAGLGAGRWGAERLRRERVCLRAQVQQALDAAAPLLAAQGLSLFVVQAPGPLWLHGDADRLLQVVGNLLSNAARFTPRGGQVRVHLQRAGDEAMLTVSDTGCGLAPGDAVRIFRPFVRGHGAAGRPGMGLGLAIVRLFTEQHGGHVTATSDGPGCGSCFSLRLPLLS